MTISIINNNYYVTGFVFKDGSSLFYGPFGSENEAKKAAAQLGVKI